MAKWLVENATESTKKALRVGDLSIYRAYTMTKWLLSAADDFTRRRIESGEVTLDQAYRSFIQLSRFRARLFDRDGAAKTPFLVRLKARHGAAKTP